MTVSAGTSSSSHHPFISWLEGVDQHATEHHRAWSMNQDLIRNASMGWRLWFEGRRAAAPFAAFGPRPQLARGAVPTSGLADDYPIGLFSLLRNAWSLAAGSLAIQGAAMLAPGEFQDLARAILECGPPAFAPTPSRVALEAGGFRLREMFPGEGRFGEPIVVLAPLVNRWYVLDFAAGESFIGMLGASQRPIYLVEWLAPSTKDERSFGDLAAGPLRQMIEHVARAHDRSSGGVALAGYSTGGVLATLLAARYPDRVTRLATVCAPVRFSEAGDFAQWLSARYLDVEQVAATYDQIPAWLAHLPFWWLKPSVKIDKLAKLCRDFKKPNYVRRFLANEIWNHDNIDLTAGTFRSWVGDLFQRDALVHGEMVVDGQRIQLERLSCPLLVVSGEHDAIIPPASAEALTPIVSSSWKRGVRLSTTHTGAVTGARSLNEMAPHVAAWIEAAVPS